MQHDELPGMYSHPMLSVPKTGSDQVKVATEDEWMNYLCGFVHPANLYNSHPEDQPHPPEKNSTEQQPGEGIVWYEVTGK